MIIYDSLHVADTFRTECNSGLNAVHVIGIDQAAADRRHRRYILENIALSNGGKQAVGHLWQQWWENDGAPSLSGLGL
jgi:hypothetical protein